MQSSQPDSERYELVDFGNGRKLERVAGRMIERPSPAAQPARPWGVELWRRTESRFAAKEKRWIHNNPWPDDLDLDCHGFRMPVTPTPFGHIGLFPEQADNWRWLQSPPAGEVEEAQALNLFAYTGAATLALVSAGYRVAHVDAAKPNVVAAKAAAAHNGWADKPIRFLVDDAAKFVSRELRRQHQYHTIVLDPPSYGHSPRGQAWRLRRDLWPLLRQCLELLNPADFRLLVTAHSPDVDEHDIAEFLERSEFSRRAGDLHGMLIRSGRSQLTDRADRQLDAGCYVRASSSNYL